jgi:hypothetical protein
MYDPIENFQIATNYIAVGDYVGALPFLHEAAKAMAGDPDFDALLTACEARA